MTLTEGVERTGPHKGRHSETEGRVGHDRAIFLLGLEFGFKQHEGGSNLDAAITHAWSLPLFEDKP